MVEKIKQNLTYLLIFIKLECPIVVMNYKDNQIFCYRFGRVKRYQNTIRLKSRNHKAIKVVPHMFKFGELSWSNTLILVLTLRWAHLNSLFDCEKIMLDYLTTTTTVYKEQRL